MLKEIQHGILIYSPIAVVFPLIAGLIRLRSLVPEQKSLLLFIFNSSVFSFLGYIYWYTNTNNLPLLHIYTISEFGAISWFYRQTLKKSVLEKFLFPGFTAFVVFALMNACFIQDWHINTLPRSIECMLIIIYALFCYHRQLKELTYSRPEHSPVFWINTGFLIYFSGALLLFTLSNYILPLNHQLNIYIWTLHALFSIIEYLFIFIALCLHPKK
jgi:hypothetical protein